MTTITIWYDTSDPENPGWAARRLCGDFEMTWALDSDDVDSAQTEAARDCRLSQTVPWEVENAGTNSERWVCEVPE